MLRQDRPFVRLHVGQSVDGKISAPGLGNRALGGPLDRRSVARVRAWADAVVMGAGTVRQADVPLRLTQAADLAGRAARGQAAQPRAVVLSGSGRLPAAARIFRPGPGAATPLVALGPNADAKAVAGWRALAQAWHGPCACPGRPHAQQICVAALLAHLHSTGVRRLLLEGGGATAWSFAEQGALDEVFCTLVPCLLGGAKAPTPLSGAGFSFAARLPLQLRQVRVRGDLVFLRYRVRVTGSSQMAAALCSPSAPQSPPERWRGQK